MNKFSSQVLRRAAVVTTAVGIVFTAGAAMAAPLPSVTWKPAASASNIQFNSFQVSDYSQVLFTGQSGSGSSAVINFAESGFLPISVFNRSGGTTNLNGYSLYIAFDSTGTVNQSQISSGTLGNYQSLKFSFYELDNASVTYSPNGGNPSQLSQPTVNGVTVESSPGVLNPLLPGTKLATGTLETGTVFGSCDNAGQNCTPGARVMTTFTPVTGAAATAFFIDPTAATFALDLSAIFTNTPDTYQFFDASGQPVANSSPNAVGFNIFQGGGNANFVVTPVPEPTTLALMGISLLGLGLHRRGSRRSS